MKRKFKFIILMGLMLLVMVAYQNCSKIKLEEYKVASYKISDINIDFCTTPSSLLQSQLKFIFVLDRSGSNQARQNNTVPGTDPTGIRRFPPIVNFLTNFTSLDPTNTYYSFINFSTQPSVNQFGGQNFTNNQQAFTTYVDTEGRTPYTDTNNPADGGWTNYRDTLLEVQQVIDADIARATSNFVNGITPTKVASTYVVFFISDGEPLNLENGAQTPTLQPLNQILSLVRRIVDLQNTQSDYVDGVSINTAYYSTPPNSALAEQYLQQMAQEGYGTYLSFLNGEPIDLSAFTIPPRLVRFGLKELWITNASAVWEQEYFVTDTDSDGMSDQLEQQLQSNPNRYDSDGNGLGDGFENSLYGRPCTSGTCAARANLCPSMRNPAHYSGMLDTDLDDLNDCEEQTLTSDIRDPDHNRDYIPDGLAMKWGLNVISASNATSLDPDNDGMPDYAEVKYNSPRNFHNQAVPNLRLTQFQGRLVSSDAQQDCYHFDVADMVFLSQTDLFRVYIIENTTTMNERRVIRRAEGPSNFGAFSLTDADFVRYQP